MSDIYDYTCTAHDAKQAATYLTGLETALSLIVNQPNIGKARPEIHKGLRSYIYQEHTIFYRVMPDYIRIVRILHKRRDMLNHFTE